MGVGQAAQLRERRSGDRQTDRTEVVAQQGAELRESLSHFPDVLLRKL
jgi:hypothetical protein